MTATFISFIRRKVFRTDKYRWDYQYLTGQWNGLKTKEMQRLDIAKDLITKCALGGKILEIGCGEGVFFQNALKADYSFYKGIDLSEVAISRINTTEKSVFV